MMTAIESQRKHGWVQFQKALKNFIEKTEGNKRIGWT
jgi:hypothetical protein